MTRGVRTSQMLDATTLGTAPIGPRRGSSPGAGPPTQGRHASQMGEHQWIAALL